jgi:ATP-dependent Clp protease ATP-binding subunit ClpC
MFERYTENARRALFFARYEASQLGDLVIKTEHLLLGLVRSTGTAARILTDRGVSLEDIRRDIESRAASAEKISTSVEIPFDREAKVALQFAAEESDRLAHHHIGTEHLLLGLLRVEKSSAAAILMNHGLQLPQLREVVAQMAAERPHASHSNETSALIHALKQLLDRLGIVAADNAEVRSQLDEIRQRVTAIERQLGQ